MVQLWFLGVDEICKVTVEQIIYDEPIKTSQATTTVDITTQDLDTDSIRDQSGTNSSGYATGIDLRFAWYIWNRFFSDAIDLRI